MQPRITQVPPTRYSSASITRAPWPAAMRAARTPPEPPPMTKRSVSKSAMVDVTRVLQVVTLLLHLGAEAVHHFLTHARRPLLHIVKGLVEHERILDDNLPAERRLVEREHVLQLLLAETLGIEFRCFVHEFVPARAELSAQLRADIIKVLGEMRIGLQQRAFGLLDLVHDDRLEHRTPALGRD